MPSARLLPRFARLYPGLSAGTWYPLAGEEPTGVWLEAPGGDPFLHPGRRFVCREHFEVGHA